MEQARKKSISWEKKFLAKQVCLPFPLLYPRGGKEWFFHLSNTILSKHFVRRLVGSFALKVWSGTWRLLRALDWCSVASWCQGKYRALTLPWDSQGWLLLPVMGESRKGLSTPWALWTLKKGAILESPRQDPVQEGCLLGQRGPSCQRLCKT